MRLSLRLLPCLCLRLCKLLRLWLRLGLRRAISPLRLSGIRAGLGLNGLSLPRTLSVGSQLRLLPGRLIEGGLLIRLACLVRSIAGALLCLRLSRIVLGRARLSCRHLRALHGWPLSHRWRRLLTQEDSFKEIRGLRLGCRCPIVLSALMSRVRTRLLIWRSSLLRLRDFQVVQIHGRHILATLFVQQP